MRPVLLPVKVNFFIMNTSFNVPKYQDLDGILKLIAVLKSTLILRVIMYLSTPLVILLLELNVEQKLGKNLYNLLGLNYGLNCQLI